MREYRVSTDSTDMQHFELLIKLTLIISLALLQIQTGETPSHENSNDYVSCALLQDAIRKALAHPESVTFCTLVAPSGHYTPKCCLKNRMCLAIIMIFSATHSECLGNERSNIVCTTICFVACTVLWALSGVRSHHLAKTSGCTDGILTMPISIIICNIISIISN